MYLPDDLTVGLELWSVSPFTDSDTGEEWWEPVRTKIYWMYIEHDRLFINDCISSMFCEHREDAQHYCQELMEPECTD